MCFLCVLLFTKTGNSALSMLTYASMSAADGWLKSLLRAVTCPLFILNGMHAVIIIGITIVCLLLLSTLSRLLLCTLCCQEKIYDVNTQAKIIFEESINY